MLDTYVHFGENIIENVFRLFFNDYIKDVIEKSNFMKNTLKIHMSDEMYEKYAGLLEEKILNATKIA